MCVCVCVCVCSTNPEGTRSELNQSSVVQHISKLLKGLESSQRCRDTLHFSPFRAGDGS